MIYFLLALAVLVIAGLPYRIDVTETEIRSRKISSPVRIAVLADLHGLSYGRKNQKLIDAVCRAKPDLVLLPGDIYEQHRSSEAADGLLNGLRQYPRYEISGNHEEFRPDIRQLKKHIRGLGVMMLDRRACQLNIQGNLIEIAGLSDPGKKNMASGSQISRLFHSHGYRILLSHRPTWLAAYTAADCDLIVCGHAHGGHWCIPGTKQGVFAPQQGLLPKYTHDLYSLGSHLMYVSRGLARTVFLIPRLYNNPEIGILVLKPEKENSHEENAA